MCMSVRECMYVYSKVLQPFFGKAQPCPCARDYELEGLIVPLYGTVPVCKHLQKQKKSKTTSGFIFLLLMHEGQDNWAVIGPARNGHSESES